MHLTRRALLRGTAGAAAFAYPPTAGAAQTVVKIEIINSLSGFLGPLGDEMQKNMELYAKTHMGDLAPDIGIDLITRDDTSSPNVDKRLRGS
jgi:hypothetical protein